MEDCAWQGGYPTMEPQTLVGVLLLGCLPIQGRIGYLIKNLRGVRLAVWSETAAPLLQLRAFGAFGLAFLDYRAQGVLLDPRDLGSMQVQTNRAYRTALHVPSWTHGALLHLPPLSGGVGCPNLADRTVLQLALSYLRVLLGRKVIGRAAIRSLLDKMGQGMEGPALRVRLAELGRVLDLVEEGGAFSEAKLWTEGELGMLRGLSWVVAATDGSQQGSRLGALLSCGTLAMASSSGRGWGCTRWRGTPRMRSGWRSCWSTTH